jgi:hypothetical protein
VWRLLKKLKIELTYDRAIQLLGIYLKECNSGTCTLMFLEAPFTMPRYGNNLDALQLMNGLRKCNTYIHTYIHICTYMEFYFSHKEE